MSSRMEYDFIIIGVGGIGSAALYWLSRLTGQSATKSKILGIEQFKLGHDNGSSQDISRIIRYMYHDPAYIKLAPGSLETWSEVEEESGIKLVTKTGGVFFIPNNESHEDVFGEYTKSLDAENIKYNLMDGIELNRRFPQFNTAEKDITAMYQKDAGFVNAGLANAVHAQLARSRGAEILENTKVVNITKRGNLLDIDTTNGQFTTGKLILATGCWTNDLLKFFDLQVPITVTQEQVSYFSTPNIREFLPDKFPVWMSVGKEYDYYGVPINPGVNAAVKIAADVSGNIVTPSTRTFEANADRLAAAGEFLKDYFPRAYGPVAYSKTCLYELTPDRHFILDSLASVGAPNVYSFVGCGHGFK
ncbi:hypothetical protein RvY_18535-2 [Ramazzottius varieornatus]|uniref:FAD dependent oxidoreductase domain-containing protein n=2 Tax=Ramazzottius varieornatus TaxID=947166 RepID=A0A1D1WAK9_RAMVA|nr:hypothetical protein RvY_18535-2 [Ramazzottius varieornatus]